MEGILEKLIESSFDGGRHYTRITKILNTWNQNTIKV
jgi:ribose 5-phosphate isomerase RpiB